jgi:glycosyltransferase involved in cell wall biosynthesis
VKSFYLHEIKVNPSKITTIYYGIKINNNSIYKNILSNKLLIGFMGRLTEQKNLFSLIDCMKLLPNDICHIYGDGPLKDEINEYLKFNKIHNVLLKGSVLNGSQIIETFDVLCLPSKWEGLGLVLLEAMSNKVPIIASTAGAIPEILDNGKYGVIIEPTPINLATAISEMKNNSQKIGVVVENAYQYVKMTFSIPKMAESTLSVYKTYSYED